MIDLLNDGHADLETRRDGNRRTPLLIACELHLQHIIDALIDNGADINATDNDGVKAEDLYSHHALRKYKVLMSCTI